MENYNSWCFYTLFFGQNKQMRYTVNMLARGDLPLDRARQDGKMQS